MNKKCPSPEIRRPRGSERRRKSDRQRRREKCDLEKGGEERSRGPTSFAPRGPRGHVQGCSRRAEPGSRTRAEDCAHRVGEALDGVRKSQCDHGQGT